jgi:hypothetical protein
LIIVAGTVYALNGTAKSSKRYADVTSWPSAEGRYLGRRPVVTVPAVM